MARFNNYSKKTGNGMDYCGLTIFEKDFNKSTGEFEHFKKSFLKKKYIIRGNIFYKNNNLGVNLSVIESKNGNMFQPANKNENSWYLKIDRINIYYNDNIIKDDDDICVVDLEINFLQQNNDTVFKIISGKDSIFKENQKRKRNNIVKKQNANEISYDNYGIINNNTFRDQETLTKENAIQETKRSLAKIFGTIEEKIKIIVEY